MPKVESDTLALADGNVGGSVENLAVNKYVAFSAVNRPAGISRAGIRLLPNSESAVERAHSPEIICFTRRRLEMLSNASRIVVTPLNLSHASKL